MSVMEAAQVAQVSRQCIYLWMEKNLFGHELKEKGSRRGWKINRESFMRFMETRKK